MRNDFKRPHSFRTSLGFTLVELMITVAVLGIIAAIATPSFTAIIEQNRTSKAANELVGQLNLLRAEALRRGQSVKLCAADAAMSKCDGTSWANYVAVVGSTDVILARKLPRGVSLKLNPVATKLEINRSGTLASGSLTVQVDPGSGAGSRSQCISVMASGSATVKGGAC